MQLWVAAVLVFSSATSDGARILAALPYNGRSHFIVMEPLLISLQSRGHHLTVISSFPRKTPLSNYRDIDLSKDLPVLINIFTLDYIRQNISNPFKSVMSITNIHMDVCEKFFSDPRVQSVLDEKFDLVIGEIFGADCFNYLAHRLNAPLISWVTSSSLPWVAERTGLPDNPSYITNYFLDYSPNMDLSQRLFNTLTLMYAKVVHHYYSALPCHTIAQRVYGEVPSMSEVNKRTSLVLINSHFSLVQSRPFPPNVIEVGGIHIKDAKPLPQDLATFLDRSPAGVVLFSLGSLVRASSLPPAVIRMFLEAFAALPQRVVFKYEEELTDVPPNVVLRRWLPQSDIIAHPNVRAVITHCGLASTIEAVHFSKPVVALPFYSDQFQNANNLARRGAAVILDYDRINRQDISRALEAVLNDPRISENMARLSREFRDRPQSALQSALFWTEYVIRHQGAPHLKPASVHLHLYQYLLLDVVLVLSLTLLPIFYLVYYLFFRAVEVSPNDYRNYLSKEKTT